MQISGKEYSKQSPAGKIIPEMFQGPQDGSLALCWEGTHGERSIKK